MSRATTTILVASALVLMLAPPRAAAQLPPGAGLPQASAAQQPPPDTNEQIAELREAYVRLPLATVLATLLAMRPRRKGTPKRRLPVVQTQIILAIVGAVVMLVVGTSLARAFGIVGAAGLVRYRARIDDPKDAGVMLSTLAIGLASGVGLWVLALFSTAFILVVLWVVESFEPRATQLLTLRVKAKDAMQLKPQVERLLERRGLNHQVRASSPDEITYDVEFPLDRKTDNLSNQILRLSKDASVEWEPRKEKK
jgi:uncharacterized membrane protein YhiD involved in acid resistance